MKTVIFLVAVLITILFAGCTTPQNRPAYVWQNYSSSLYNLKKTPTDKSLKTHKEVLLAIMEESKKENCRVPPGVYCEYGYLLLKEGQKEEAIHYFDLEEKTYPESKIFIQNLKAYATKTTKKNDAAQIDDNMQNKDNKGSGGDKAVNTDSQ
jgi:hypothetical protein